MNNNIIKDPQLYKQILDMYKWFNNHPHLGPFNKMYLILGYNALDVGAYLKGQEILDQVDPGYFKEDIFKDIDEAMDAAGKNWKLRDEGEKDDSKYHAESEFFLVIKNFMNMILKDEHLQKPEYMDFLKKFKEKKYTIKIGGEEKELDNLIEFKGKIQ